MFYTAALRLYANIGIHTYLDRWLDQNLRVWSTDLL